jgi:hypothetical protein
MFSSCKTIPGIPATHTKIVSEYFQPEIFQNIKSLINIATIIAGIIAIVIWTIRTDL